MRRIMTAVVVVGPIIGEIARSYRHVRPWAAATILDLNHIVPGAFAGLQKGLPGRCGAPKAMVSKQAISMDANKFQLLMRPPHIVMLWQAVAIFTIGSLDDAGGL